MFFILDTLYDSIALYSLYQKVFCVENVRRIYQYNDKLAGAENHAEGGCMHQFCR